MHINILESVPRLWFENENGDRATPSPSVQDSPDSMGEAPPAFIFQHMLIHSVVGHDVICKVPKTGEHRLVKREYLPFDHKFVEGLVRNGDMDLRSAMFLAIEACERCRAGMRHRYKLGIGYRFDSRTYRENEARCRICYEPEPDTEPPDWFVAANELTAKQEGEAKVDEPPGAPV